MKKELNIENLLFYDENALYKDHVSKASSRIYNAFIIQGGPVQVNISATQRAAIEKLINEPDVNTYSIAETEIYKLMNKDPFPRYFFNSFISFISLLFL